MVRRFTELLAKIILFQLNKLINFDFITIKLTNFLLFNYLRAGILLIGTIFRLWNHTLITVPSCPALIASQTDST